MRQNINTINSVDDDGNPTGGSTKGTGIVINWQDGPLGRDENRLVPNGAFVEGVIEASIQRLEFFQESQFRCRENAIAITKLQEALLWLRERTREREERSVEGTHQA